MFWIIVLIVLFYVLLMGVFYFFQDYFFFRPEILPTDFEYHYPFPFEELDFDMPDGGKVNAIYFKVPNSKGVVYYLKGNSRSIKGWGKFAKDYLSNGYDFFMMDYRGFGKSKGKRDEQRLYMDSQFIYDWLLRRYKEENLVVFGRSLGSGIAAWVAANNHPRLLILDSPYYSFYHNIRRYLFFLPLKWLLRYNIRTDRYLMDVECPIHIIHGTKDRLFPIYQSEQLLKLKPGQITLYRIEGAGHNDLPDYKSFYEILYEILYLDGSNEEE